MADPNIVDALTTLIEEFSRSGVATLHVRSGDFEVLLSNEAGATTATTRTVQAAAGAHGSPADMKPRAGGAIDSSPPAPPKPSPSAVAAPNALPEGAIVVRAPNLGTFYRAPKPGADFYVEVGGRVEVGQEICLIEVMKLFTAVRAEQGGRVHAVLAEDGSMVEAGQPLFALVSD